MPVKAVKDNRQSRTEMTRHALMRAAEKLIAERGIENVSIRDIVTTAGQKNESALQYHFDNRQGLINALKTQRNDEVEGQRSELLQQLLAQSTTPTLREICNVMVRPAFNLAQSNPDFRRYIKAFGHEITLAQNSAVRAVSKGKADAEVGILLRKELSHLDEAAYRARLDGAIRFISASMVHPAKQKNAFRGAQAEVFFNSLLDALSGLLNAPESPETTKATKAAKHSSQ